MVDEDGKIDEAATAEVVDEPTRSVIRRVPMPIDVEDEG